MQNNTQCQGTGVEYQDAGGASHPLDVECSMLEVGCFPTASELEVSSSSSFNEIQARQARADLIAFTKRFFGVDDDCALPSDI
jgi:hypothetical protein